MSRNGKQPPIVLTMTEEQEKQIHRALERYFRRKNEGAGPISKDRRTQEFVFQMTDWYEDLIRLAALYQEPKAHSLKEWDDVLGGFLLHVVGHVMRAAELNQMFCDPFEVAPRQAAQRTRKTKAAPVPA